MEKIPVRCPMHPLETLSNFCKRKQCMMALCPTCVGQHTQLHQRHQTLPDYENIQQTFKSTTKILQEEQQKIFQHRKKLEGLISNVNTKKQQISKIIMQAKKESLVFVEKYYNELMNTLLNNIRNEEIKTGFHGETLHRMMTELTKNEEEIKNNIMSLHKGKSPSLIKSVHLEFLPKNNNFLEKIEAQISKNITFTPKLVYKPAFISELKIPINKVVSLDFIYPSGATDFQSPEAIMRSSCMNFGKGKVQKSPDFIVDNTFSRPRSSSKSGKIQLTLYNKYNGKENNQTLSRVSRRSNIFQKTLQ